MTGLEIAAVVIFAVGTILDTWTTYEGIKRYGFSEKRTVMAWFQDRLGIIGSTAKEGIVAYLLVAYTPPAVWILGLMAGGIGQLFAAVQNWRMIQVVRKR